MSRRSKKSEAILHVRKGASLREIYAQIRRDFTASDLQKYTVNEKGFPFGETLPELERIHEEEMKRKRKR